MNDQTMNRLELPIDIICGTRFNNSIKKSKQTEKEKSQKWDNYNYL